MAQVNLNIDELKNFVNHIIENNRFLQKDKKQSVSIEVVGESGIGKTSTIVEIAQENKLNFVKLNLAQIEELGDLVGFPIRQFQMYKEIKVVKKSNNINYLMSDIAGSNGATANNRQRSANSDSAKIGTNTAAASQVLPGNPLKQLK